MEERETNVMPIETEADLFSADDFTEDENGELQYAEEKPVAVEPRTLRVKYMGEEKELSEEEAITFAQKGMDYDPIKKELGELKAGGAHEALKLEKQIADSYGMSVADYRKLALEQVQNNQLEKALAAINKEYPGLPDEAAKELAKARLGVQQNERKEAEEAKHQEVWDAIAEAYPELKTADDIPEEVREAIEGGKDPMLAMREHELNQLKAQLAKNAADAEAEKQNNLNRAKAVGAVKPGSGRETDPFLDGLFG